MRRLHLMVPRDPLDPEVQHLLEHHRHPPALQVQVRHHFLLGRWGRVDPEVQQHLGHRRHPRRLSDPVGLEVLEALQVPLAQAGLYSPQIPAVPWRLSRHRGRSRHPHPEVLPDLEDRLVRSGHRHRRDPVRQAE